MGGSKEAALKAKATNLAKDPNYYKNIGALGGAAGKGKTISAETKRKISETKKRKRYENN